MYSNAIIVYLIIHVLGDFYLQSERMALEKNRSLKTLCLHSLIYFVLMLIPYPILHFRFEFLIIGCVIGMAHFLIDFGKYFLYRFQRISRTCLFFLDQVLHLLIIVSAVEYLLLSVLPFPEPMVKFLKWILLILLLFKPANVSFKMMYGAMKPQIRDPQSAEPAEGVTLKNAGAIIGNFERILYAICLVTGQYTAMGLIITCKGFARHSYIQNYPHFAEYFLLGTFYSLLYAIVMFALIFYGL